MLMLSSEFSAYAAIMKRSKGAIIGKHGLWEIGVGRKSCSLKMDNDGRMVLHQQRKQVICNIAIIIRSNAAPVLLNVGWNVDMLDQVL